MPRLRETTNSISTLEEQNIFHRIMSQEAGSVKNAIDGGERKGRKGKSSKNSAKRNGDAGDVPRQELGTAGQAGLGDLGQVPGVAVATQATSGTSSSVTQSEGGQPRQAPAVVPLPYPMHYPQMPMQPFFQPNMAAYNGFGAPMMMPPCGFGEAWEAPEECDERPVHQISDDEDDLVSCDSVSVEGNKPAEAAGKPEAEDQLDFSSLKTGKMAELLKASHRKAKEGIKVAPPINSTLAAIVNEFMEETKVVTEMERIAKEYPKVKNLDKIVVPKLENELFGAIDQHVRNGDISMQSIQKAVVGAISAIAPVTSLIVERGDEDKELEDFSGNMVDSIKMLTLANKALSTKRRELLRPSMQATYAKALGKANEGSPEWLYGGNLSEATRQCEAAQKIAQKVMKRKNPQQGQPQNHQARQPGQQQKRFRQANPGWQKKQGNQFQPKTFGYQHYQFPAPGNYQQYPQQGQYQQYYQPSFKQTGQQGQRQQGPGQGQDFHQRNSKK